MITAIIVSAAAALLVLIAALIIFLTAGRSKSPEFDEFFGGYFAHRGLYDNSPDKNRPENSLAAFSLAAERGFGVEFDIHISSDGVPVVFHDDTLRRLCGIDKRISELTSEELHQIKILGTDQYIPTLSEVLDIVGGRVPIIAELKCSPNEYAPAALCEAAAPMLEARGGRYCIESFNPYVVGWYKKNRPNVFRGQLSEKFKSSGKPYERAVLYMLSELMMNFVGRPDFVSYNCRHTNVLGFKLWRHLYGGKVSFWTVRDADTCEKLLQSGEGDCVIFERFVPERKEEPSV